MERRRFSRVFFLAEALIDAENESFSARIKDLAYGGAYLYSSRRPSVGQLIRIRFFLDGLESRIEVSFTGEVVRHGPDGFAVRLKTIDFESLHHLKKIIYYNLGDPDQAERELKILFGESLLEL